MGLRDPIVTRCYVNRLTRWNHDNIRILATIGMYSDAHSVTLVMLDSGQEAPVASFLTRVGSFTKSAAYRVNAR